MKRLKVFGFLLLIWMTAAQANGVIFVKDLELPVDLVMTLKQAHIETVEQLTFFTGARLRKIPGLGEVKLRLIRARLAAHGLSLSEPRSLPYPDRSVLSLGLGIEQTVSLIDRRITHIGQLLLMIEEDFAQWPGAGEIKALFPLPSKQKTNSYDVPIDVLCWPRLLRNRFRRVGIATLREVSLLNDVDCQTLILESRARLTLDAFKANMSKRGLRLNSSPFAHLRWPFRVQLFRNGVQTQVQLEHLSAGTIRDILDSMEHLGVLRQEGESDCGLLFSPSGKNPNR